MTNKPSNEVTPKGNKRETWDDAVAGVVAKLRVGANFGSSTVFKPKGSAALADLISTMARRLDGIYALQGGKGLFEMTKEEFDTYVAKIRKIRRED